MASAGAAATMSIRRGSRWVSTTGAASRSCLRVRRRARRWKSGRSRSQGAVDEARSWKWDEFTALPAEAVTVDIHCVTK
jgi:hypothetical protein